MEPGVHQNAENVFLLTPLLLNFPIVALCFSASLASPLPPQIISSFSLSASSLPSPVISQGVAAPTATVLNPGSVTAPLRIFCMLYRQPNGGNQSTQMRLDRITFRAPFDWFGFFLLNSTNKYVFFPRWLFCFLFALADLYQIVSVYQHFIYKAPLCSTFMKCNYSVTLTPPVYHMKNVFIVFP